MNLNAVACYPLRVVSDKAENDIPMRGFAA